MGTQRAGVDLFELLVALRLEAADAQGEALGDVDRGPAVGASGHRAPARVQADSGQDEERQLAGLQQDRTGGLGLEVDLALLQLGHRRDQVALALGFVGEAAGGDALPLGRAQRLVLVALPVLCGRVRVSLSWKRSPLPSWSTKTEPQRPQTSSRLV